MIKILIAEDQDLIRESFNIVLSSQEEFEVVALAKDGQEAVELASKVQPDVVLLDIRMPNMDGIAACREIKKNHPDIKVIVLTTFDDDQYIIDAIKYGANGYLLKGVGVEELVDAIKTTYNDGTLVHPKVASRLFSLFMEMTQMKTSNNFPEAHLEELTKRENEILREVAKGLSNKEIAESLFLSEGTVRNSISTILSKLNLRDRTQLALHYVRTVKER